MTIIEYRIIKFDEIPNFVKIRQNSVNKKSNYGGVYIYVCIVSFIRTRTYK